MKTEQRAARCNHRAKDHQCVVPLVLRSSAGAAPQVVGLVKDPSSHGKLLCGVVRKLPKTEPCFV